MQFPTLTNQPDDKDDDHLQGQRMPERTFFCKVVPAAVDFNGCCQRPIVQAVERQLKPLPFIGLDSYAPLHPPTPTSPQTPTQTLSTPPPPQSQPVRVSGHTSSSESCDDDGDMERASAE